MKKSITAALGLMFAIPIAACDQQQQATPPNSSMPTAGTATSAKTQHGKGEGTITEIDASTGSVTLYHGAIDALGWPSMTMSFAASQKLLEGLAVGDRVNFELDWNGEMGRITHIEKKK